MKGFRARIEFMRGVPINPGTFLAVPDFDELNRLPTGQIIKFGSVSGQTYKVAIAEHQRQEQWRKRRINAARNRARNPGNGKLDPPKPAAIQPPGGTTVEHIREVRRPPDRLSVPEDGGIRQSAGP